MAVVNAIRVVRDALRVTTATATISCILLWGLSPAAAQPTTNSPATKVLDAPTFIRLAHSSAVLQARAAELVASRDTRPEARTFAQIMVEFRREQRAKLEAAARENRIPIPSAGEFEHRVLLENLEPLDFLALSRRYAEVQVQALEQEVRGYMSAESSSDEWVSAISRDTRPHLERLLEQAREMRKAVGP